MQPYTAWVSRKSIVVSPTHKTWNTLKTHSGCPTDSDCAALICWNRGVFLDLSGGTKARKSRSNRGIVLTVWHCFLLDVRIVEARSKLGCLYSRRALLLRLPAGLWDSVSANQQHSLLDKRCLKLSCSFNGPFKPSHGSLTVRTGDHNYRMAN